MNIFLKIYPVASIIVESGEAFFVIAESGMSVSSSPVKLPLWPVAEMHTFYKLIFFGPAYVKNYTEKSRFMFHVSFQFELLNVSFQFHFN